MDDSITCPICRNNININDAELITYMNDINEYECCICLEIIKISNDNTLSRLKCLHIFCTKCLDTWIKIQYESPVINNDIDIIGYIRLRRRHIDIYPIFDEPTSNNKTTINYKFDRLNKIKGVYECNCCGRSFNKNGFSRNELKKKENKICQCCKGTRIDQNPYTLSPI